jgi:Carboxypeptidase regulatory-like domain/TonB dependent receptor
LAMFALISVSISFAQSQANAADLAGKVVDPNGASVPGATVIAKNQATGISRTVTTDSEGEYQIIALPPGNYEVTAEAKTFKKVRISPVTLTVGQSASLQIKLEVGAATGEVIVTGDDVELLETTKTSVSTTIDQARIQSLPINERSATGFALTISTVGRDNGRPIGPAPTSGLNIGGQRGRSTLVQVDGSDFTDNSVNAARSTVSQEAVQEYQVATNSYTAEFGRATGGVVNVVTKRGGNDFRGNIFGYLRDKSIQSRNPFAPEDKPAYTRGQYGVTFGGRIIKDKTFFFTAFERNQRNESGFFTTNVAQGLTSSVTLPITGLGNVTFNRINSQQAAYANALVATGSPAAINAAVQYLYLASSGGNTALTGINPLISPGGAIPAGSIIGSRFFLSGAPVPSGTRNAAGEPIAFRPLLDLQKVFPIRGRSNFFSLRGDHSFNDNNQLSLRFGYNPSFLSGIQVESQNQSLGQNDFSRTGITDLKDYSFGGTFNSVIGNVINEAKFSYGQRNVTFKSQNGDATSFNISGTAFIGRELFSPVRRTEKRFQIADNVTLVKGSHTVKFGGDVNFITIPDATFELNFAGLYNFGEFAATNLGAFPSLSATVTPPSFTPVQSYGLGLPSIFIQGFGNPVSRLKNKPVAFFVQDSWKVAKNLTLNYGLRYDFEFSQQIAPVTFRDPLSGINLANTDILAAQDAIGVQQGFPRDKNNWAPRFAFAWDVFGTSKTVIRGAIGLFYDHPLLAVGFNSDIADAAQQQQAVLTPGNPSPTALLNATQVFQGTVCVPGATPTAFCAAAGNPTTPGVAAGAQYQFGRQRFNDQTFSGFGAVLPFTLPIAKDFQHASATQANFAVEHQLDKNTAISASYIYVGAHHLPRPTDLNAPRTDLQIQNFQRFNGGALPTSTQAVATVTIASTAPGTATGVGCFVVIPGIVASCLGGRVVAPAIANFFRPSAPNYFLAQALSGGAVTKAVLDAQLAGSLRTTGVISPFGSVNAQVSDGNSSYNALNLELKRRLANNFQFIASYTWSHSIDDSSDLQTLLVAQDTSNFKAEKSNSLFDQRHRLVFSGVLTTPTSWRNGNGLQKFFSDFAIAPIIELSSGRPFNIITNVDANNDQSTQTDRPAVLADGTLCVPGTPGCTPLITDGRFSVGSLGRNAGLTRSFASFDLGVTRAVRFGERYRLDIIAQGFNMFNRFNEGAVSPLFSDVNSFASRAKNGAYYSRATASFDPRQFQFGLKFSF